MSVPRVSILMSVREGAFLEPAVRTATAQTMDDFELVLIDDASDEETAALVRDLAAADARIRLVRRDRSAGLAAALNHGLTLVRAPLVARADADDEYAPHRLEAQLAVIDARPDLGVLSCGYERIDEAGRVTGTHRPVTGPGRLAFRQMFQNQVLHPGAMFRTALVREAGGYDAAYWTAQDSDLWARLLGRTEIDNLAEPLVRWRKHGASTLASRGAAGQALSGTVTARLMTDYLGAPVAVPAASAAAAVWRSQADLRTDDAQVGLALLKRIRSAARMKGEPTRTRDLSVHVAGELVRRAKRAPREARAMPGLLASWMTGGTP